MVNEVSLKSFKNEIIQRTSINPTQTGGGGGGTCPRLTFPKYYIGSIWQKKFFHIATCHDVTAFLCHDVIKKIPPF